MGPVVKVVVLVRLHMVLPSTVRGSWQDYNQVDLDVIICHYQMDVTLLQGKSIIRLYQVKSSGEFHSRERQMEMQKGPGKDQHS